MAHKTVSLPSGNLFAVAAHYLGDATQWNLIAALNGMVDPFFLGPITLNIPDPNQAGANGGILGQ